MKQLPGDLKSNGRLTGTSGKGEQDTISALGNGLQHAVDRDLLIEAEGPASALIGIGNGGEAVAPVNLFRKSQTPEFFRGRILRHFTFRALRHVDTVDPLSIGGVGVADGQLARIVLCLRYPFRQFFIPCFGLNHREFVVAIDQHVIGGERLPAPPTSFETTERDGIFAEDFAALDDTPACDFQRGVNMLGSSFGFVHNMDSLRFVKSGMAVCV